MRARSGVAIPTALFVVLLLFVLGTVAARQASLNLRLSQGEAQETRWRQAARAAVNRAILLLNEDPSFESYSEDSPFQETEDGLTLEAWATVDPDHPKLYHVHGRAFPRGSPHLAQSFERIVRKRPDIQGITYAQSPIPGANTPDSIFYRHGDEPDWQLIPPVPLQFYRSDGTLETVPGEFTDSLYFLEADNNGNIYAHSYFFLEGDDPVTNLVRSVLEAGMASQSGHDYVYELAGLSESIGSGPIWDGIVGRGAVMKFNVDTRQWTALPPIPNMRYDASGNIVRTGGYQVPGLLTKMHASDDHLFVSCMRQGGDLLLRFNHQTETWDALPPPPNQHHDDSGALVTDPGLPPVLFNLTGDENAEVYAQWGQPDGRDVLYKKTDTGWDPLPPVPRKYYTDSGLVERPGFSPHTGHAEANIDSGLHAVYWASMEDPDGADTLFRLEDGEWQPIPPPQAAHYDAAGRAVPSGGINRILDSVGIDAEGKVLLKALDPAGPDAQYSLDKDYEVLPPLPRHRYDDQGQLVIQNGYFNIQTQIVGGGFRNTGGSRYVPTAEF